MCCNEDYNGLIGGTKKGMKTPTCWTSLRVHQITRTPLPTWIGPIKSISQTLEELREDGYLYIAACSLHSYDNIFEFGFTWT